jgi:hypothetical protein
LFSVREVDQNCFAYPFSVDGASLCALDRLAYRIYVPVMFLTRQDIWDDAVARHSAALKIIVAEVLSLLAAHGGLEAVSVPRVVRRIILRVLRPAESALRRIIVIAARNVRADSPSKKAVSSHNVTEKTRARTFTHARAPRMAFQLFDPRKRFGQSRIVYTRFNPRVSFIAADPPFSPLAQKPVSWSWAEPAPEPVPDNQTGAKRLCLRLKAFSSALEDVPRQAKRLVRLRARREQKKSFFSPLRIGKPPGHRNIRVDDVDYILAECHDFAYAVLAASPDTS